ncbi:MAG: thiol peroxidase [Allobaculum sp.]|uniref:thiol peroxidase n=1 Tax=Allobaculum sp. TaxID=1872463 RepID=UPI00399B553D
MITFGSKPVTLEGTPIKTGDTFPSFKALDADFNEVEPMSKSGKTIVLAVPSIDTPVCSLELGKFLHFMNGKPEVRVISVSQDLPFALARWNRDHENDRIETLSNFHLEDFSTKTGTKMKENGLLCRAAFVVDENGKIIYDEYVSEVANEPDYVALLEAAGLQ